MGISECRGKRMWTPSCWSVHRPWFPVSRCPVVEKFWPWLTQEDQGENEDDRFARLEKLIVRATKKKDKAMGDFWDLPKFCIPTWLSGSCACHSNLVHSCGKSPFSLGKSTISMANVPVRYVSHYQRVLITIINHHEPSSTIIHHHKMLGSWVNPL